MVTFGFLFSSILDTEKSAILLSCPLRSSQLYSVSKLRLRDPSKSLPCILVTLNNLKPCSDKYISCQEQKSIRLCCVLHISTSAMVAVRHEITGICRAACHVEFCHFINTILKCSNQDRNSKELDLVEDNHHQSMCELL